MKDIVFGRQTLPQKFVHHTIASLRLAPQHTHPTHAREMLLSTTSHRQTTTPSCVRNTEFYLHVLLVRLQKHCKIVEICRKQCGMCILSLVHNKNIARRRRSGHAFLAGGLSWAAHICGSKTREREDHGRKSENMQGNTWVPNTLTGQRLSRTTKPAAALVQMAPARKVYRF